MEAGVEERACDRVFSHGKAVDGCDEQAGAGVVVIGGLGALDGLDEELGEGAHGVGAGGLLVGEQDLQVGVAAAEVGRECAVDENDAGTYGAGEGGGVAVGIGSGGGVGPAQERAVGVGGVGGGEDDRLAALFEAAVVFTGAKGAEEIDRGGLGELGRAEVGCEVAAADAAGFFEGFEDVVDGTEASGEVFRVSGLAEDDAVAGKKLLRDGVRPVGLVCRCVFGGKGRDVEGPAALRGGRGGAAGAEALLVVDAASGFGGAARGGALGVGAQGVEGVVGDEAAPDEGPECVDCLAGVAAPECVVEGLEEAGAVALEVAEDGQFTV